MITKRIGLFAIALAFLTACGSNNTDTNKPATSENSGNSDGIANKNITKQQYDEGLALITASGSDCLGCHKIDQKLIGPAYQDVADKYDYTPENVELLATRIINGSQGIWGEIPMKSHSELSKENAEKMVRYIFALKK